MNFKPKSQKLSAFGKIAENHKDVSIFYCFSFFFRKICSEKYKKQIPNTQEMQVKWRRD